MTKNASYKTNNTHSQLTLINKHPENIKLNIDNDY